MKTRRLLFCAMVLLFAGCMTRNAKEAYVRAKLYTAVQAEGGDVLAGFITNELTVANKVTGADSVPDAEVALDVEAVKANTVRLEADYKAKLFWSNLGKGVLDWLGSNVPWLAPVIGGAGAILALGKKLFTKTKALGAAIKITTKVKEAVSGDATMLEKVKGVMTAAKTDGADFVSGSKELYAEYVKAKSAGKA